MKFDNIGIIRIFTGLLFLVTGISYLIDQSFIMGLVRETGLPLTWLITWILILVHVIFGFALTIGWKTKIAANALLIILVFATLQEILPLISAILGVQVLLFHILGIIILITLQISSSGEPSFDKNEKKINMVQKKL